MKKLCVLAVAMLLAIGSFAQSMNVQTAFSNLKKGKLAEALEAIQPALEHAQTVGQAKTWLYYGNICYDIATTKNPDYAKLLPNPMEEALRGYKTAKELDKKKEYSEEIERMMGGVAQYYYDKGVDDFENKSYESAANNLMHTYQMQKEMGNADPKLLIFVARSYLLSDQFDKAENVYNELKQLNHDDPEIYVALAKIAIAKKDVNKAAAILNEGEKKYPENAMLLGEKANLYLTTELADLNRDEAANTLKKLIALNPNEHLYYYNLGVCYAADSTKFAEAEEAYKKCIELDPNYVNGYINLSNIYVKEANNYVKEANTLPMEADKQYNELVNKSKEMLNTALPYMEKAYELDPNDAAVKHYLKEIYTKLGQLDKAAAIK